MLRLLALIYLFLTCGLLNALNCYDCSTTGTMTCTATCTGATSCVYQVNVPLMASNQQLLRCEYNTSVNGCTGSLATNNVICYCTTDLCNKINTSAPVTVGTMGMSSTPGMGMAAGAMMPGGVPTMSAFGMPSVGVTLPPLGAAVQNGVASVNAVVPNVAMPGAMPGVMSSGIPTVPDGFWTRRVSTSNGWKF
ncbi:hypothetical protein M3Y97_00639900 [Aphelenchoides bicaudatus]|nr:hypothetical protein M3Y97_00639900 [Aphelenchoides bicaudatus]